ncbi:uncharacterized protein [Oscarella lobularis]|uniref:uncharacterized protein n=1 Tax=Oscarella lobularis TaxID=121494 RepID=UPI003313F4D2
MFRASQSLQPSSNKLLQEKWDASTYMSHRDRVKKARTVSNKLTHDYSHIRTKAKKRLDEERRYAEIEKGNRRLVEHMTHIMYNKGRVDHFNEHYVNKLPSLNYEKRRREATRVERENAEMIKKLGQTKGCYSNAKLASDWRSNEQYMALSSHHRPRGHLARLDRLPVHAATVPAATRRKSQESTSDISVGSGDRLQPSFDLRRPLPQIGAIQEEPQAETTT